MPGAKPVASGRNPLWKREITVGVVGGHASEREALVFTLARVGAVRAVDCGTGLAESITRALDLRIEHVLLALDSGPATSFAAALRSAIPGVRMSVLLEARSGPALGRMAEAGIVGFVPPGASITACVRVLRAVHSRGFSCPPEIAAELLRFRGLRNRESAPSEHRKSVHLRGRPLQIAGCLAEGLTNKEISARLRIAEGTVKAHVHAVLKALGVEHRWEVRGALASHPGESAHDRQESGMEES